MFKAPVCSSALSATICHMQSRPVIPHSAEILVAGLLLCPLEKACRGDKGLMGAPAHGSGSRGTFGVWEQFRVDHIGADTRLGLA